MKRNHTSLFSAALVCSLILTGCGGGSYDTATGDSSYKVQSNYAVSEDAGAYDTSAYPEESGEYEESYEYDEVSDVDSEDTESTGEMPDIEEHNPSVTAKKIDTEKLIYTCNLSIDTLDFEESTKALSALIEKYEGFIESEDYSDGGSYDYYSYYYIEDESKHDSYNATIRIPSTSYDSFLEEAATLGDVRSKNSSVQNVSQEYSDLNVSLEIYQAAYDRYMKLLSEAEDESYALKLQQKITDTQIEIARIKTRLNKIDTDVSYSFVNIHIKEVAKYDERPLPRDTFAQRLVSEIKDTAVGFLEFLEELLFLIIHLIPYIALIAIIAAIIRFIRKKMGKRPLLAILRERRQKKKEERLSRKLGKMPYDHPPVNIPPEPPKQDSDNK